MTESSLVSLRQHVASLLDGGQAFAKPARIVEGVPPDARGAHVDGFDHSLWQLLEHLRIAQRDILDFCVAAEYREIEWPREYWPQSSAPPSDEAWDRSITEFLGGIDEARRIALDESIDLFSVVPHGTTQSWLRELLLIADHNAHHLGQFIMLRKLLGIWKP